MHPEPSTTPHDLRVAPLVASLTVVVPVYRSAATLPDLARRLDAVLPGLAADYEVLLVNDGSPDASWQVIETLAGAYPWLTGINLMRNSGQHNALLCGIRAARGDVIVTMDDDLQHPPEELHKLLARLNAGYDVCYGTPQHLHHSGMRNLASRVTKLALQSAMGAETASKVSAFRAFRAPVGRAFARYTASYANIDVLLTWGTMRFTSVDVRHDDRAAGQSNYTLPKLIRHALNMITGFSVVPLQLASMLGFASVVFGLLVLVWVIGRYVVEGGSVPGFPFLASTIAIFSGVQLFALGIIGEYLARMHLRLMDRPPYVIRETTADEVESTEAGADV